MKHATGLVKLNARDNPRITTVEPFAATLRELDAGWRCCISDEGLKHATGLVELDAWHNQRISMTADSQSLRCKTRRSGE